MKTALSMSMMTACRPLHHEAVGAGDARAVEQGVDRDRVGAGLRRLEIDMGEVREFLGLAEHRDVDGEAARREAVLEELADGAEIGGAEEGDPVVLAPVELAACAASWKRKPAKPELSGSLRAGESAGMSK